MKLWQMEPSRAAAPRLLASLGDTFFEPGLTVHGKRLITMEMRWDANIRKVFATAEGVADESVPLTKSNRIDNFPHLSPDGRRIAFESTRYGGSDIFVMAADGSNTVQLTSIGVRQARSPRWRPDGAQVAFAAGAKTRDIYVIDAAGGKPHRLVESSADDSLPSWSPDGRRVFFTSDRSGRQEIWSVPASGGQPIQLTFQGGYRPLASPEDEFVYYTKQSGAPHGAPLWRVRAAGGGEEQVFDTPVFHPENFDVVAGRIYYCTASAPRGMKAIRVFDLETGEHRELARMGLSPTTGLSVSPDGSFFLFSHTDSQEADLVMFTLP
jgi:Tol biopolymer transport system component